jgi:hypothetical protein
MIFDEFWFHLNIDHELIYLGLDEKIPENEISLLDFEKFMFTMVLESH